MFCALSQNYQHLKNNLKASGGKLYDGNKIFVGQTVFEFLIKKIFCIPAPTSVGIDWYRATKCQNVSRENFVKSLIDV